MSTEERDAKRTKVTGDHETVAEGSLEGSLPLTTSGGSGGGGIFTGEALENLQYFAEIARKQKADQAADGKQATTQGQEKKGMGMLGGYGSESEED